LVPTRQRSLWKTAFVPSERASDKADKRTLPAHAVPFSYSRAGPYVGVHAGYGGGRSGYQFGDGSSTGDFDVSGWLGGAIVGMNWQSGPWVVGVEADYSWTDIDGSVLCPSLVNTCATSNSWLATARIRVGYAYDGVFPYLTGGVAFGDIKADISGFGSSKGTETGWTVGAGVEASLEGNWTGELEYLYIDLGKFNCDLNCSGVLPGTDKFTTNVVRVGLNYRFASGKAPASPVVTRY
jgi:outer membrane immunogenic protein